MVEQVGAPLELYDRPANLFVAGFIGSPAMNLLKGEHRGERFRDRGAAPSLPLPKRMGAAQGGLRHPAGVHPPQPEGGLRRDGAAGRADGVGNPGHRCALGETPLVCTFRERVSARPGDTIRIMPDRALAHVFDAEKRQPDYDELDRHRSN